VARKSRSKTVAAKGTKKSKTAPTKIAKSRSAAPPFLPSPKVEAEPVLPKRRLRKTPLSKSELNEFRQMLLEKRRALVGDMTGMAAEALRTNRQEGTGNLSKIPTHDADVGTDNFEQEFTLGLLESERALLSEIDEALDRISKGTYGICLGTGQAIPKARLRARPWAKYCIEYAKMVEKGLAPRGGERRQGEHLEYGEDEEEQDSDAEGSRETDSSLEE